jgi:shikimate dehydrogenase
MTTFALGLAGHPVAHSVSPAIHTAALAATGLEGRYEGFDVDEPGLARLARQVRDGTLHGLNVTVPYKQAAFELCDEVTSTAEMLGVVNTLSRTPECRLGGDNTDLPGLLGALREAWPELPWRGETAAVLGAGGAARAAVRAALELGAGKAVLVNRTIVRAEILAAELRRQGLPVEAGSDPAGAALVLQATSLGTALAPGTAAFDEVRSHARSVLALAAPGACLMDLVYRPPTTPWMAAASERGLQVAGGLEMLVRQAALSFERWTGRVPPLEPLRQAARKALGPDPPGSRGAPGP